MQRVNFMLGMALTLVLLQVTATPTLFAAILPDDSSYAQEEKVQNKFKVRTDRDARLRLDVDAGAIRMSPGQSKDHVEVYLVHTKTKFRHAFRFNQGENALEIRFEKDGWFEYDGNKMAAELEIKLPRDATLRIDCTIKAGEVEMELGGLRLVDFAMKVWAGEVNLDFDEPNRVEMESLDLNTKIGESKFRRLGNARFRDAEINGGIGEMTIDFSGAMLKEAVARIDLDIGETVIILPQDAGTKLSLSKFLFLSQMDLPLNLRQEGRYYYTENYQKAERLFQLRVHSGIGALRIKRD